MGMLTRVWSSICLNVCTSISTNLFWYKSVHHACVLIQTCAPCMCFNINVFTKYFVPIQTCAPCMLFRYKRVHHACCSDTNMCTMHVVPIQTCAPCMLFQYKRVTMHVVPIPILGTVHVHNGTVLFVPLRIWACIMEHARCSITNLKRLCLCWCKRWGKVNSIQGHTQSIGLLILTGSKGENGNRWCLH